jgi:hypothetical protein
MCTQKVPFSSHDFPAALDRVSICSSTLFKNEVSIFAHFYQGN